MEIFNGDWTIDPTEAGAITGDKEAFLALRPPNVSEEDLKLRHNLTIKASGKKAHIKMSVPGKFEKEDDHTLDVEEEKELPGGKKGKVLAHFANGRLNVKVKGPDRELQAVRYIECDNMITELTTGGKSCKLRFKRA